MENIKSDYTDTSGFVPWLLAKTLFAIFSSFVIPCHLLENWHFLQSYKRSNELNADWTTGLLCSTVRVDCCITLHWRVIDINECITIKPFRDTLYSKNTNQFQSFEHFWLTLIIYKVAIHATTVFIQSKLCWNILMKLLVKGYSKRPLI